MSEMEIKTVTPADAWKLIQDGEDITIIDVRNKAAFDKAHIAGARSVPFENAENFAAKIQHEAPNLDAVTYVYCLDGLLAAEAVEIMDDLGYTNAYSLGGVSNWPYAKESAAGSAV